jgi:glyoxylase-like metal-dependent hydrolase (beta-lactamase superfamily II)
MCQNFHSILARLRFLAPWGFIAFSDPSSTWQEVFVRLRVRFQATNAFAFIQERNGTYIEIESGRVRILLDMNGDPDEPAVYPDIDGLSGKSDLLTLILSHGHVDHLGLAHRGWASSPPSEKPKRIKKVTPKLSSKI